MQNLIIAIIGIALVVAATASGVYYGGDIYTTQTVEAEAAKMRNERNMLIAAVEVYKSDGNELGNLFKFTYLTEGGYLTKVPDGWIAEEGYAYRELDKTDPGSMNVCYTANLQDGYEYTTADTEVIPVPKGGNRAVPLCSKEGIPSILPCCISE